MPPAREGCRSDWLIFGILLGLALVFFVGARTLPDYRPGRQASYPREARTAAGLPVQDFAYIFNYARSAAQAPGVSPYSIEEHRRFLKAWMGAQVTSALCFAYTPTTVLILAPLFWLPTAWAWLVWNTAGAWAAGWTVRQGAGADRALLGFGRLGLVSPTTFYCLALGQTALVTTGLLAAIVHLSRPSQERTARAGWGAAGCLFVLTMKPPLALVGASALLAAGCWRPLLAAGAAALAVLAAAVAWWSVDLIRDYQALIASYNLEDAPLLFRMGFHPEVMSNLRNVLLHTGRLDDAQASALTWLPLAGSLVAPLLVAVTARRWMHIEVAAAWAATGYALFSPHLSPTEDMLLVMVMLWLWPRSDIRMRYLLVALCVGPQLLGSSTLAILEQLKLAPPGARLLPLAVFGAKVLVAVLAARALLVPPPGRTA